MRGMFGGSEIAPGLVLPLGRSFYDIATLALVADAAAVNSWPDSYHGLYDLSKGTAAAPLKVNDSGGGLPAVVFDGATMRLESSAVAPRYDITPPCSFFVLFKYIAAPAAPSDLFELTDSATAITMDTSGHIIAGAGSTITSVSALATGVWIALSVVFNGAASRLRYFTAGAVVEDITGNMGTAGASGIFYVMANSSLSTFMAGYLAQIVIIGTAASDADINGFEQSVRAYTG